MSDHDRFEQGPKPARRHTEEGLKYAALAPYLPQIDPNLVTLRADDTEHVRRLALVAARDHLKAGRGIPAHIRAALEGSGGMPQELARLDTFQVAPKPARFRVPIVAGLSALLAFASGIWVTRYQNRSLVPKEAFPGMVTGLAGAAAAAERAQALYDEAVTYMNLAKHEQAVAAFSAALRLRPDWADAYYNRAVSYQNLEKCDEAVQDFTQVIRRKPVRPTAYYNRAVCYMRMQRLPEAEADLTAYITQTKPSTPAKAFANRAKVRSSLGNEAGAKADRDAAAEQLQKGFK